MGAILCNAESSILQFLMAGFETDDLILNGLVVFRLYVLCVKLKYQRFYIL